MAKGISVGIRAKAAKGSLSKPGIWEMFRERQPGIREIAVLLKPGNEVTEKELRLFRLPRIKLPTLLRLIRVPML